MRRHIQSTAAVWVIVATLLAGLVLPGPALAQQTGGQPAPLLTPEDRAAMGQIYWQRMQSRLGLTDQQVTEIRALLDAQRASTRANVQGLIAARKQLRSLLDQPAPDQASIQAAATQVKTLQAALFDARLQTQLALRAKFTAEQWQQWQTLRKGMRHRWMRHGPAAGPGMF
jgi:Spy/CpxP family protein refolding chaperone